MKLLCAVALIALAGCGNSSADYTDAQKEIVDGFDADVTCTLIETLGGPRTAWDLVADGTENVSYDEWSEVINDLC